MTLDATGHPVPGWPWSPGDGGDFATAALGPDGSTYVLERGLETGDFVYKNPLHRLSASGQEMPGFPIALPDGSYCDLTASSTGIAYSTCQTADADGNLTGATITAVGPDGSFPFAAPVAFSGDVSIIGLGPDQLPIIAIPGGKRTVVRALAADGSTRWSTATIPGDATLDLAGRVWVTRHQFQPDACGGPIRTTYEVLAPDGSRIAGWPVTLPGWSSMPAVLADGSMVVLSASGRALRYGLNGRVSAGWPVRGVDVSYSCNDGSAPVTDGHRVAFAGKDRATVVGPGGRVLPGWPANPAGEIANACPGCTPGSGATLDPVLAADGTLYVATVNRQSRPEVVAIGADGSPVTEVLVGAKEDTTNALVSSPDGRVWALTDHQYNDQTSTTLSLVSVAVPAAP